VEFLPETGAERTIVDGPANLEQKIGPSPRPAHLLRLVHPPVHQEIGRRLGDRGANPQSGTVPLVTLYLIGSSSHCGFFLTSCDRGLA
jgi:hypothetical protein